MTAIGATRVPPRPTTGVAVQGRALAGTPAGAAAGRAHPPQGSPQGSVRPTVREHLVGRLTSPVLVGRAAEVDSLLGAVAHAPALVLLEGEAGVGKTRLVREALARPELRRHRRLFGQCDPLREPLPLAPVVDALRGIGPVAADSLSPLAGTLRPLLPELAAFLPAAPPALGDARAERHRVFRALVELLAALGPAVVVLEDLHWADETTLEFLRFALSQQPATLTFVWTFRREDLPAGSPLPGIAARLPHGTFPVRLALAPLAPGDVGSLVGAILETERVSSEFAGYLHERTAGLPFAVEEILCLLQERGDLVRRPGGWARRAIEHCAVPSAIRDSLLERMSHLSEDAAAVVHAAAVLLAPAGDALLARMAELDVERATDALSEALRSGLLHETSDGRCAFRHSLARQAVYEDLPGPERRRLHLAAGRALEALGDPLPLAHLAHHFRHAQKPAEWAAYAEAAAEVAAGLHDDVAVCHFLQEALAAPTLDEQARLRIAKRLASAAMHGLEHAEAARVLAHILDEPSLSVPDRGELRRWLGVLLVQAGDAVAGVSQLTRAVDDLAHDPVAATRAMMSLAVPWVVEGTLEEHTGWLDRAAATMPDDCPPEARLAYLTDRATALLFLGDSEGWAVAEQLRGEGGGPEENRERLRGCLNLAQAALYLGHVQRAEEWVAAYEELAERVSSVRLESIAQTIRLQLDGQRGRWDDLEERAAVLCESMAHVPHASVDVQVVWGLLLSAKGEVDAATDLLEAVLEPARSSGSVPVLAAAAAALARIALQREDHAAALAVATPALDVIAAKGIWVWGADVVPAMVEAHCAAGDHAAAAALLDAFESGLQGRDGPAALAALREARALVAAAEGDRSGAIAGLAEAAAAWDALPRPYEAAAARERCGALRLAAGDEPAARADLETALEAFCAIGAAGAAARTRALLRAGENPKPRRRGGRRGYGNQLSPREEEVVALVGRGLTNREIATELYLSPRTVEDHVAKAMRKLGVGSRRELEKKP